MKPARQWVERFAIFPLYESVTQRSELTIWDARTIDILARIAVPIAIPLGFHGGFELQ